MEYKGKYKKMAEQFRNDGVDEQDVHDPAIHALLAEPDGVAQAIDSIARDPGRPSLLPFQLGRDHKQGNRQKQPFNKSAYDNKILILHFLFLFFPG